MSMLRFAALIAIVLAVVPLNDAQRSNLWAKSHQFATWAMSTCERSPDTCEQASIAWDHVKKNAKQTIAVLDVIVREYATGSISNGATSSPMQYSYRETSHIETGSLSPSDLAPQWRGTLPTIE